MATDGRGRATGGAKRGPGDDARAEAEGEAEARRAAFRRRVERGEYRGLLEAPLPEVMAQAAAERGLAAEAGALRVVLARLLAEEADLGKLALGVARVATASARLAQARQTLGDGPKSELEEAMMKALDELDAEFAGQDRLRRLAVEG